MRLGEAGIEGVAADVTETVCCLASLLACPFAF